MVKTRTALKDPVSIKESQNKNFGPSDSVIIGGGKDLDASDNFEDEYEPDFESNKKNA